MEDTDHLYSLHTFLVCQHLVVWRFSKTRRSFYTSCVECIRWNKKNRTLLSRLTHHYLLVCRPPFDSYLRAVLVDLTAVYAWTTPCSTDSSYPASSWQSIPTTNIAFAVQNLSLNCRLLGALLPPNQSLHHLRHCPIETLLLAIVCYGRLKPNS